MKAMAVFPGKSGSIHLADLPEPSIDDVPNGGGVLVEVIRVGVDGTDKEINDAEYGAVPSSCRSPSAWYGLRGFLRSLSRSWPASRSVPPSSGFVEADEPLRFMALIGLAFLLFLARMEIDLGGLLRGGAIRSAGVGFVLSLAIAFAVASGLGVVGLIQAPLLVAIMLSTTSLGIVVPVLADTGQSRSTFLGQLIIAGSSSADFAAVILLSLFFSGHSSSLGSTPVLIWAFVVLISQP
jgi:hypothetical protein